MRGTGCVGSQSFITNDLGDETIVGVGTDTDIFITGVVDDIQVDVIKSTDADEFTFSATVFDFALCGQGVFKFNLTIFLCRCLPLSAERLSLCPASRSSTGNTPRRAWAGIS